MNLLLLADMSTRAVAKLTRDYHGSTLIHPIGALSLVALGLWLLLASRKSALTPLMILICFIPSAQRIVLAGADFTLLRIMVLFGLLRIIFRGETSSLQINRIDIVYVTWVFVGSLVYVAQQGTSGSLVYVCGTSMDMLGAYAITRTMIRNKEDLLVFGSAAATVGIAASVFFLVELSTGKNMFSVFGGVGETTSIRDGRLRCQGAFSHPILAGVFWSALGAFFVGCTLGTKHRIRFALGTIASIFIIVASSSSTPLLGFVAGLLFWVWWPFRSWMRYAFASAPVILVILHLCMEAPVWHLVTRVSAVGGSTAYHRYVLINGAVNHFHEWWLLGSQSTAHWSQNFQTFDLTNQYILEGVRGGIWRLSFFLLLIFLVSKQISNAMRKAVSKKDKLILWGLGASMFVHCTCFIGVSYFGQIQYLWYMTLAICGSTCERRFFLRHPGNSITLRKNVESTSALSTISHPTA